MNKVINTERAARENPIRFMLESVEATEKRGQDELCASSVLPVRSNGSIKESLIAAGVVFGEPIADDGEFCNVTLPQGWKIIATDHAMWSNLVDDEGVVRASIFYKAAHYDRHAELYQP